MAEPLHPTPRPRLRWRKLLMFGIGAALLGSLAAWYGIQTLAGWRWDAMKSRLEALRVQSRSRSPSRPALYGSMHPGNAWEDYALILKQAEPLLSETEGLMYYADGHPKGDPAKVRNFLSSHSDLIRALSAATHRESATFPESWEADARQASFDKKLNLPSSAGRASAKATMAEGSYRPAVEMLLDQLVYARDVCHNAPRLRASSGLGQYRRALTDLKDLVTSPGVPVDVLIDLDEALERADASFPDPRLVMERDLIEDGDLLTSANVSPDGLTLQGLLHWRYMFSWRVLVADAFQHIDAWSLRISNAYSRSGAELARVMNDVDRECAESHNVVAPELMPIHGIFRSSLRVRAQLHLLRVATHYLGKGQIAKLDDPFGDSLRFREHGNRLSIWSIGPDGVDQGGLGSWSEGQDIVLEVERH